MCSFLFKHYKQLLSEYRIFLICVIFVFISTILSRCSMFNAFIFLFVQVAFIYLPGYTLVSWIGIKYENKYIRYFISYATGYSLSIFIYLILLMMGIQSSILYVYLALFVLSGIYLSRHREVLPDGLIEKKEKSLLTIFFLISLIIGFFVYHCYNINPSLMDGNWYIFQDLVYWFRNAVAATKSYPLPDLSFSSHPFYYHYFSSIEMAFLKYTTGIEMYDLCFTYSYLITILLILSGLYTICKFTINSPKYLFIPIAFILFTSGFDEYTHVYLYDHIFIASFGFAEGVAMFCFSLYFYFRLLKTDENHWRLLLITMLSVFVTTGLKGPLAAILLVGFAIGSAFLLFIEKRFFHGIIYGLSLFLSFILALSLFVININHPAESGSTSELLFSPTATIFHSHYFERGYDYLIEQGIPAFISYSSTLLLYFLLAFFSPILVSCAVQKMRRTLYVYIIFLSMTIAGILFGIFMSNVGFSQVYFIFVSIICFFILPFISTNNGLSPKTIKSLIVIFVIGSLPFAYKNVLNIYSGTLSLLWSTDSGRCLLQKANKKIDVPETGLTISKGEVEGLRWGRDNIPENSILLTNKIFAEQGRRSFWTSCLTEKQIFLEGYDFSNVNQKEIDLYKNLTLSFYEGDSFTIHKLKEKGVTHAILFKNIQPNSIPQSCNVLYENSEIIIVSI